MGVQNTGQNLAASLTPPLLGALISAAGYATGFGLAAVIAGIAALAVPVPRLGRKAEASAEPERG
jgi:hypothetical protein